MYVVFFEKKPTVESNFIFCNSLKFLFHMNLVRKNYYN